MPQKHTIKQIHENHSLVQDIRRSAGKLTNVGRAALFHPDRVEVPAAPKRVLPDFPQRARKRDL